jgi:hypothetical protein
VRGGYTDAKLFKLEEEYQLYDESCSFKLGEEDNDWVDYRSGDWTSYEGEHLSVDEITEKLQPIGESGKQRVEGFLG